MQSFDHHPNWTTNFFETPPPREKKRSFPTPVILFVLTVLSTIAAGCFHQGVNIFLEPWKFYKGLPFAITLLLILGIHESGHYFLCKLHRIPATVPYFIPMPNILGTMGAFIKIKGAITNRRALLDIGMAGPLAGFIIALPATIIGYILSPVVPTPLEEGLVLGNSILTWILEKILIPIPEPGYGIMLHPVGFAGYIGLFVTAMNLLPVGQLDGSHVITALLGEKQHLIAKITLVILIFSGMFWSGWWLWAVLLLITGIKHPVIRYDARGLDATRKILAWITVAIFILTFVPVPFSFTEFTP
ncbi:MAG: site-2 protease family protein [bacterium]